MQLNRRQFVLAAVAAGLCGGASHAAAAGGRPVPPYPAGMTEDQVDALFERALAELQAKTEANVARWGIGDWDVDLERGVIGFATRDGGRVQADVQVIGTYVAARESWMWGWDHPSVPAPIAAHARLVRDFGQRQGLLTMQRRVVEGLGADMAWGFTALAAHLAGAAGAYRGPTGGTFVFMTHGTLRPV